MITITPQAKRLQIILKEIQKSNRAFAAEIPCSETNIRRMKTGEVDLNFDVMRHVCVKYGYSPDWMITGLGNKKTNGQDVKLITEIQTLRTEIDIVVQLNKQMHARMQAYETENKNLHSQLESLKHELLKHKKTG